MYKGKKRVCLILMVIIFLTNIISPTIVYALEKGTGKENVFKIPEIPEDIKNIKNYKAEDGKIISGFYEIFDKLNTKDNITNNIITKVEIDEIKKLYKTFNEKIPKVYIGTEVNGTAELFELKQKIANYCNLFANSRNTNGEIKKELNKILYEIVNVNDSLLEKMIRLSEEVIKDKAEGIEHNIVREMKTNKESALTIAKSGGEIQSVDIQKYMYKKRVTNIKR